MMDMQSLLFDFYWQYFKVLLIDVHKENITFFVMINDKVGLSTAYSCKHQYSIFSRVFIFQALFPDVWTISHFFPLQVFATAFLSPISAFDRNLFRSVSPNLPLPRSCILNSSIVTPAPRRRHIYEKVSSQTLLTKTTQVTFSD